jgi:signal transduction histidine kinase
LQAIYLAELDARAAAEAAERRLRFIAEAGTALSESLDYHTTVAAIVDLAVPFIADWCAVDIVESPGVIRRLAVAAADPSKEAVARALEAYPPAWSASTGAARVIRTGRAELYEHDPAPPHDATVRDEQHRALLEQLGLRSRMIVPMIARGKTCGALSFGAGESGRRYTLEDLALAEELARRAALAMENARLYQELTERKAQLQKLLGRVLAAHEEERRRVAYEIHDGLAQVAVAAHQHLQGFAHRFQPRRPQARVELGRALELSQRTVREARRVIAGLRPTALDDFGLAVALRIECEALRAEGWDVTYEETLAGQRLPSAVETALFRVAQEAITNVRKHAHTRRVRITLEPQGSGVRMEVRDWGRGFRRADGPRPGTPGERVGLEGMRERITLLGGCFRVHSWPGRGAHIIAEVPLAIDDGHGRGTTPKRDAGGAITHGG